MTLEDAVEIAREEHGLTVISTLREDRTIQTSVVNAGSFAHPVTGAEVLALVAQPGVKVRNLRVRPQLTATFRSGWRWAAVEGIAELLGPEDGDIGAESLRLLLRDVFVAAGGTHDDWAEYDRVMAKDRRVVVLVAPTRVYSN